MVPSGISQSVGTSHALHSVGWLPPVPACADARSGAATHNDNPGGLPRTSSSEATRGRLSLSPPFSDGDASVFTLRACEPHRWWRPQCMELRARGAQSEALTGSARNAELVWVPCKAMSKYCEAWRWCSREAVPSVDDTGSDLRRDCLQPDIGSCTRASRGRAILESIEPLNHSRMDDAFEGTIPLQPHVA